MDVAKFIQQDKGSVQELYCVSYLLYILLQMVKMI